MAGFAEIDYRQLNRLGGALEDFNAGDLRTKETQVKAEQDQSDRKIAEQAAKEFYDTVSAKKPAAEPPGLADTSLPVLGAKPVLGQMTLAPGLGGIVAPMPYTSEKERTIGAPEATPSQPATPSSDATPSGLPDYEKVFTAAAKAGEVLAKGGGRHSQAAAQRIHQYVENFVKIKALQPRSVKEGIRSVPLPDGTPDIKMIGGVQYQRMEKYNVETGQSLGPYWGKEQGLIQPRSGGGGASQREKDLEKYRVGLIEAKSTKAQQIDKFGGEPNIKAIADKVLEKVDRQKLIDDPAYAQQMIVGSMVDKTQASQWTAIRDYIKSTSNEGKFTGALHGLGWDVGPNGELVKWTPPAKGSTPTTVPRTGAKLTGNKIIVQMLQDLGTAKKGSKGKIDESEFDPQTMKRVQ